MLYPEIKCPYCRIGFGGIKIHKEKIKDNRNWFKKLIFPKKSKFKMTPYHLDILWSSEYGLQKDCLDPQLLLDNLIKVDDLQNPIFNEEFQKKLTKLREKFETNPDDISKDNFTRDEYLIAAHECINWGSLETEEFEYDTNKLIYGKLNIFYDKGVNLKEALVSFLKPVEK